MNLRHQTMARRLCPRAWFISPSIPYNTLGQMYARRWLGRVSAAPVLRPFSEMTLVDIEHIFMLFFSNLHIYL